MRPRIISARNVDHALVDAIWHLRTAGYKSDSRNGPVVVAPGPVITVYARPWERLVSYPERDANHVFHLMETIWMLAGQRDVRWLLPFNAKFADYAEQPSMLQHGAYGWRWMYSSPAGNQLTQAVAELKKPDNRRVVVQMWSAVHDLGSPAKDVPCNTHIYFQVIDDKLEMTVCCRSNDMVWGAYGANAVHFSFLQQLMAEDLGIGVGHYCQFSNNFHCYTQMGQGAALMEQPPVVPSGYWGGVDPQQIIAPWESLDSFIVDCRRFVGVEDGAIQNQFLTETAQPLSEAYLVRKAGGDWRAVAARAPDCDWRRAFIAWAERRGNGSE